MSDPLHAPYAWTSREALIAASVARGHTNRQIARSLGVPVSRFTRELADLFDRIGSSCRAELVARAYVDGALDVTAWPPESSKTLKESRCERT